MDDFMEMQMRVKGTCPKCSTVMTFEEGATYAKKHGIDANVVMCSSCRSVYTIDLSPSAMTLVANVTDKYQSHS